MHDDSMANHYAAPILLSIVGYTDDPIKEEKVKRARAPFHVLFSNDTTNTLTCVSPYHKKGEPFREKTLKATVDETAGIGIEVHMLQPAHGWVPWWQSKVYSVEEHHRWWKDHYGVAPDMSVHNYLLKGGDVLDRSSLNAAENEDWRRLSRSALTMPIT